MISQIKNALRGLALALGRWQARRNQHPVRVAQATAADIAAMEGAIPAVPGRSLADELADQSAQVQTILLVWKGPTLVASGFIHWAGPRYASARGAEPQCPEIFRLHVRPAYRSMGLGSLMIDHFETMARSRQCPRVGLGVAEANLAAAALYGRLGYSRSPQADFVDEFETVDRQGQRRVWRDPAHFLVKTLVKSL